MNKRVLQRSIFSGALMIFLSSAPALAVFSERLPAPQESDPAFEVATIKVSDSGAPTMQKLNEEGRYFTARNTSLADLIQFAYDVQERQIIDPSGQAPKDRYDISAVSNQDGTPTVQQVRVMLQKLLADRFRLAFHKDKRKLSAFVLATINRTVPKLNPTQSSGPIPVNDVQAVSNGWTLSMRNASTIDFTRFLQTIVLDRPVVDSTAIPGKFDISVTFTPDEWQFHGHPPPVRHADNGDTAPGLFDAIRQQLGLRLEPQKVPVDVMVIDHIERPSPN